MSKPEGKGNPPAVDPTGAGNNVDKIRDILFGSQMRDYESRFARLGETLLKESADLRQSTAKSLESLEAYFKTEMEALGARQKAERDERSSALKQMAKDMKRIAESLDKKIEETDDHSSEGQAAIRKEMLAMSKNLLDQIRVKNEEVLAVLEKRFQ